jgi:hypothetical protein
MANDFERIDFHDWRLFEFTVRTIAVSEKRYGNEITFRIRSDERSPPSPPREVEVTFQNARGLRAVLNLKAKTACYDSIFENLDLPKDKNPELPDLFNASANDHLYVLVLTSPGGEIEVVAEGVTVKELTGRPSA